MDRFHLVVSNYKRIISFVGNFHMVRGFDIKRDKVYIFDCSPLSTVQGQLEIADRLVSFGLRWGDNLFFIRRRNWCVNHGAQLDYIRCIQEKTVMMPKYTAFVQEHYFDLQHLVQEDTIPEEAVYDLDRIDTKFRSNDKIGCVFHARNGVRVSVSNPVTNRMFNGGHGTALIPKAIRRCFFIDGGNFIVRPQLYLNWFEKHPYYLTKGDGSYGFAHVWEIRLGKIIYDQKAKWVDMHRNIEYNSIDELDDLEEMNKDKYSALWYDFREYFFLYGRDMIYYKPLPFVSVSYCILLYIYHSMFHSKDTRLTFVQPC